MTVPEHFNIFWDLGPRSDDAHVPFQHVHELGKLIKFRPPEYASDRCDARVADGCYLQAVDSGIDHHGPELEQQKGPKSPSDTDLAEQDRTTVRKLHDKRDKKKQRTDQC